MVFTCDPIDLHFFVKELKTKDIQQFKEVNTYFSA